MQPPNIREEVASFTFGGIRESAQAPQLKRINPTIITRDSLVIEGEGIYAKVRLEPFDSKSHKIVYDDDEKTPIKIDRRPYYGDYGTMPRTSIASIIVVIDGDTAAIPPTAYSDLKNMQFKYFDKARSSQPTLFLCQKTGKMFTFIFLARTRKVITK